MSKEELKEKLNNEIEGLERKRILMHNFIYFNTDEYTKLNEEQLFILYMEYDIIGIYLRILYKRKSCLMEEKIKG